MTDYVYPSGGNVPNKFSDRDALPPGDPEKVIKGLQLDQEFNALVTAVNSKLDKAAQAGDFTGLIDGGSINGGTF